MKRKSISIVFWTVIVFVSSFAAGGWAQDKQQELLGKLSAAVESSDKLHSNVKKFVIENLLKNSTNPILIAEVTAQNNKKVSLDTIKGIDEEWKAKEGRLPLQEELMANRTAVELNKLVDENAVIVECFVTDNQGANVGQYNETSDYWQGDEAKWKNSFNDGNGGVDVGAMEIDQSTALAQQQVSLPIMNGDGQVIGSITYGLDVNAMR